MKRKEIFGLALAFGIGLFLVIGAVKKENICYQKGIAGEIIRFHVIADSDREADQLLKLKVKEAVVEELRGRLSGAEDIEEARGVILDNIEDIEALSNKIIEENGFDYEAHAALGQAVFPIKMYGDLAFPAGEYEALRIELGRAEGKNWWCVMFPTLCYVDEAKEEITEENKEKFKEILTEEEYESLEQDGESKAFYKLKIGEYLHKVIDYFSI